VDPAKTIGIALWAGQARGAVPNSATCYGIPTQPRITAPRGLRQLFLDAYSRFADLCREVDEPGLALLAVDEYTGAPAGLVRLRARVGRHVAAIVGRHDACDLYLDKHTSLALRHLAIVLDPVSSWQRNETAVRYRVLDLRTETGFSDEHGKTMHGLRADGPAILRCASHAIFVLPLGDATDWPAQAADAWDMLPDRVYFDEMQSRPEGSHTAMPIDRNTRRSFIYRTHGPRETGQGLVERGDSAGTLEIIGETRYGALKIGANALRDGILLGRYARCDGAALLEDPAMSRVHALLVQIDDALLIVDTASRNGTFLPGQDPARVIAVTGDSEINLGKHTRIRWRWAD
jgi:FHA domain